MKTRSLSELLQLPVGQRHTVMAAGLTALLEHVQTLMSDCEFLLAADRKRSARCLNLQAEEEAAKVLILLSTAGRRRVRDQPTAFGRRPDGRVAVRLICVVWSLDGSVTSGPGGGS